MNTSTTARILIVDDEEVVRLSFMRILASAHCKVKAVWSWAQVAEAMQNEKFDIVLLDLRLPDGSNRRWRWYDPAVLDAFLQIAQPAQVDTLMSGVRQLVTPRPQSWTWYRLTDGALQSEQRSLLAKAG